MIVISPILVRYGLLLRLYSLLAEHADHGLPDVVAMDAPIEAAVSDSSTDEREFEIGECLTTKPGHGRTSRDDLEASFLP